MTSKRPCKKENAGCPCCEMWLDNDILPLGTLPACRAAAHLRDALGFQTFLVLKFFEIPN